MRSFARGLGWIMMATAGLVLFVSVLAVLEQLGWGSQDVEPLVIVTMVGIFGAGVAVGALGAYLAFLLAQRPLTPRPPRPRKFWPVYPRV